MKTLPKWSRLSGLLISLVSALGLYLVIMVTIRLEDVAAGKIQAFSLREALSDAFLSHWHVMVVWFAAILAIAIWRRHTMLKSHDREELLQNILETTVDGIYVVDQYGQMTFANHATESILGLKRDDIAKRTFDDPNWKITTPDGKPFPAEEQPFARIMRNGEPVRGVEQSIERADGKRVMVSVNAAPVHNAKGAIVGEIGTLTDITERKQTEAALAEERNLLRTVIDNLPYQVFIKDLEGRYIVNNREHMNLLGVADPADAQGKTVFDFFPRDIASEYNSDDLAITQSGKPLINQERRSKDSGGEHRWREVSKVPLCDTSGKIVGLVSISRDVTERKCAQEALRQSESRHRALIDAIPDSMFLIGRNGVLLDYKPPTDRSSYLPYNEHVGKKMSEVTPPDIMEKVDCHLLQVMQTSQSQTFEYQIKDSQTVYDREARIVRAGEDDAVMIVRDITDRKNVDRLKNEFISIVSHELRTPLTSIRGSLGLIAGGAAGKISEQAKSLVDIAHKNSERLIRLINDILDIEKIESGKMVFDIKPTELMPLLDQAIEANRAYGDQFGVKFVIENGLPGIQVNADPDRLTQVITNLLSNSAKFSPRGTSVDLSVSRTNSTVRVAIRDHGEGIPEEFQTRIFQKFAQADSSSTRQKGGTGLGLNICKAIVERLRGQIGFETAPNAGTTFYFELPEWHVEEPVKPIAPRKPRVLICEDDHDTAMLLKLMLEQGGYAPEIAYDAAEAKELLRQNDYAGMTLDLVLPDENGISLIRELRDQDKTRDLPIVVVSMSAEKGRNELNGDAVQVIDWVSKPIDPQRLLSAVRQAAVRTSNRTSRILHVEDDPDILKVVSVILGEVAQVEQATSLNIARRLLRENKYELVILDIEMPDGSGLDLIPLLREQEPSVPAVIFSVEEVKKETAERVSATLVKSRTSNEKLVQTIQSLIHTPVAV